MDLKLPHTHGNMHVQSIASNKLHDLLEENDFGVVTKTINKFSLFETIKKMS